MRYHLLFVFPYLALLVIVAFGFSVVQRDQDAVKSVTSQQCVAERSMYRVIASGLRNRARIEREIPLPAIEGNAQQLRAHALILEAQETDRLSLLIPNCAPVSTGLLRQSPRPSKP